MLISAAEAPVHEMHGARFTPYVRPATGSSEICVWQTELPAGSTGVPHRIGKEEAFVLLAGRLRLTVDGVAEELSPGDAALAPAGSMIAVDNIGSDPVRFLAVVPVGFAAELPDGSTISPPWVL